MSKKSINTVFSTPINTVGQHSTFNHGEIWFGITAYHEAEEGNHDFWYDVNYVTYYPEGQKECTDLTPIIPFLFGYSCDNHNTAIQEDERLNGLIMQHIAYQFTAESEPEYEF